MVRMTPSIIQIFDCAIWPSHQQSIFFVILSFFLFELSVVIPWLQNWHLKKDHLLFIEWLGNIVLFMTDLQWRQRRKTIFYLESFPHVIIQGILNIQRHCHLDADRNIPKFWYPWHFGRAADAFLSRGKHAHLWWLYFDFDKSGSGPCLQDRGERLSRWRRGLKLIGKCWRDRSVDSKREWLTLSCCPHWQAEHDNGDWGKGRKDLSQGINRIPSIKRYECSLFVVSFQLCNMIFHFWDNHHTFDARLEACFF